MVTCEGACHGECGRWYRCKPTVQPWTHRKLERYSPGKHCATARTSAPLRFAYAGPTWSEVGENVVSPVVTSRPRYGPYGRARRPNGPEPRLAGSRSTLKNLARADAPGYRSDGPTGGVGSSGGWGRQGACVMRQVDSSVRPSVLVSAELNAGFLEIFEIHGPITAQAGPMGG